MLIGVPKETKSDEHRVAMTPAGVKELVDRGHTVLIEREAGIGSDIPDESYRQQGASIVPEAQQIYAESELIVKVKEPQQDELEWLGSRHILFTFLHLAADERMTRRLMESRVASLAYETVVNEHGRLPLLTPMSEVAGRIATQIAASLLEKPHGGRGILPGGVTGVAPAEVVILGAGTVGAHAAAVGIGMGADVYLHDRDIDRLREVSVVLERRARMSYGSSLALEERLPTADVVIGAVLIPGARAPRLLNRDHLALMKRTAILLDVSVDQGGCFETSRPTTHSDPTFQVDGVTHYCVANMPGSVPVTATLALTNATLPYIVELAAKGVSDVGLLSSGLRSGVNTLDGSLVSRPVAAAHGIEHTPIEAFIGGSPHQRLAEPVASA